MIPTVFPKDAISVNGNIKVIEMALFFVDVQGRRGYGRSSGATDRIYRNS